VELPRIDGLRIVEMMRRLPHVAEVPVYVVSAISNPAYAAYAKQLAVERYLQRPFESRDLAREIRRLMECA
jgi:CheY-like chemotaxis protein